MRDGSVEPLPWRVSEDGGCPVAEVLRTLGGKHKPQILHLLTEGPLFALELGRRMPQASRKVLTAQLRDLEAAGLVTRRQTGDALGRVSYGLSEKGRALTAILGEVYRWSQDYP